MGIDAGPSFDWGVVKQFGLPETLQRARMSQVDRSDPLANVSAAIGDAAIDFELSMLDGIVSRPSALRVLDVNLLDRFRGPALRGGMSSVNTSSAEYRLVNTGVTVGVAVYGGVQSLRAGGPPSVGPCSGASARSAARPPKPACWPARLHLITLHSWLIGWRTPSFRRFAAPESQEPSAQVAHSMLRM